jgi:hypothetical protein
MSYRNNKTNVSDTVTSYLLLCNFNPTSITDNSTIADAFVFSTGTLVILDRTENALTEQSVSLGLMGSVVDGFRFQHLSS